jgi:hypothetical protein
VRNSILDVGSERYQSVILPAGTIARGDHNDEASAEALEGQIAFDRNQK